MPLILQLPCFRSFRYIQLCGFRCYFGVNQSLNLPASSRINCLMPKSLNVIQENALAPKSNNLRAPEGFIEIYNFGAQKLRINSLAATILSVLTLWTFYTYKTKSEDTDSVPENGNPPSSSDTASNAHSAVTSWWGELFRIDKNDKFFRINESDKVYHFIILPFIISLLIYMRTGVVLVSYRRGEEYLTYVTKRFGFGNKVINHGPHEVIYYPHRRIYKHELKGEKVIIFQENFINSYEEDLMCTGGGMPLKGNDPQRQSK